MLPSASRFVIPWHLRPLVHALDRMHLGVNPAVVDVDAQKHGHGEPDHDDEEEKSIADVASAVSNEADDKQANERARLSREGYNGSLDDTNANAPCL